MTDAPIPDAAVLSVPEAGELAGRVELVGQHPGW